MKIKNDVVEAIGNTPLIALKRASAQTGCTILGKAEFMNPGQSVKDRAARQMILEAENRGEIAPGGLVVESTAGNTGIGLALVANARGYRTLIVIPETQRREKKKDILIGVADPKGAAMYNLFAHGEAKASEGGSITEGIGLGRVTALIEDIQVDKPYLIPDEEAVPLIFDLLEHEGLCMGGSTGINLAGAIRLAKDMGPGHTIVTILADYGTRYQPKLFNPTFLREKGLPVPEWLERTSGTKVPYV